MSDRKVVGIFERKAKNAEKKSKDDEDEGLTFDEIAKKNKAKAEKLARERAEANKSVIRSYRLKP